MAPGVCGVLYYPLTVHLLVCFSSESSLSDLSSVGHPGGRGALGDRRARPAPWQKLLPRVLSLALTPVSWDTRGASCSCSAGTAQHLSVKTGGDLSSVFTGLIP